MTYLRLSGMQRVDTNLSILFWFVLRVPILTTHYGSSRSRCRRFPHTRPRENPGRAAL